MLSINEWLSQTPFGIPRQGLKIYIKMDLCINEPSKFIKTKASSFLVPGEPAKPPG
jgi:hypothetical protein